MAGRTLGGRYTVQDKIGTGGMAIVYRGLDEVLGRTVAVKIMLPQYANDQSFAARFKQEAQAAAALQSPYIVSVYDWGKDGNTYYIVMEYLRGTDLKSGIRKHGALDCRKVAQIGSQISQALTVAHRHDIIHRDIKPQNIMVQPDGNVKVMDFGIARAKNSHLTADNSVLGTAHYVSPEQTQGKDLGPTTDIYSLGIVMYEAATGRVPFDGDDAISVALKQVNEPPMPPSQINPMVDSALEGIILKCMQKRPEDRFQTADELYRVLRDYLAGRMQSVIESTSVVAQVGAGRTQQTNNLNGRTQGGFQQRPGMETTGHYRKKRATEENLDRKHRRNVVIGVVVSLVAIVGIALAVFMVLGRPKTRAVPNLVGLSKDDAITQVEQSNYFKVGNVKEEYSSNIAVGKVSDQDPDEGNNAKQGTSINLWISKGPAPEKSVTVPDLTNMTPTEAETALSKVGLVGKSGDSVNSDEVEVGKIAAQSPAKDTTAKAGSTVTYQLSKGPEEIEVPNVIGWSQSSASDTLREAGFTVVVNSEENDSVDVGVVFYQSVTGTASKGSEIVLTVSSGSSKAQVPGVVGLTEGDAMGTLAGAGFNVATSYAPSDAIASGYVMSQSLSGLATKGSTVEIQISTGPERPSGGDSSGGGSSSSSTTPSEDTGGGTQEGGTEGGGTTGGGGGTETTETPGTEHEAATS